MTELKGLCQRHWVLVLMLAWMGLGSASCSCSSDTADPMGASPAPPASGVTINTAGLTFSPSSVTVPSGTVVTFNAGGHTVNIDDSPVMSCSNTNLTSFPATHTFIGPSGTVFHIHCNFHSPCGTAFCALSCTGMVMTVAIQ